MEQQLKRFLEKSNQITWWSIKVDSKKNKLFLKIKYSSQKSIRPQQILANILGIENPVFFMAREKVLFKNLLN